MYINKSKNLKKYKQTEQSLYSEKTLLKFFPLYSSLEKGNI